MAKNFYEDDELEDKRPRSGLTIAGASLGTSPENADQFRGISKLSDNSFRGISMPTSSRTAKPAKKGLGIMSGFRDAWRGFKSVLNNGGVAGMSKGEMERNLRGAANVGPEFKRGLATLPEQLANVGPEFKREVATAFPRMTDKVFGGETTDAWQHPHRPASSRNVPRVLGAENTDEARAKDAEIMAARSDLTTPLSFSPTVDFKAPTPDDLYDDVVAPDVTNPTLEQERKAVAARALANQVAKRELAKRNPQDSSAPEFRARGIRPMTPEEIEEAQIMSINARNARAQRNLDEAAARYQGNVPHGYDRSGGIEIMSARPASDFANEEVGIRDPYWEAHKQRVREKNSRYMKAIEDRNRIMGTQDANPRQTAGIRMNEAALAAQERMERTRANATVQSERARADALAKAEEAKARAQRDQLDNNLEIARGNNENARRIAEMNNFTEMRKLAAQLADAKENRKFNWEKLKIEHDLALQELGVKIANLESQNEAVRQAEIEKLERNVSLFGPDGRGVAQLPGYRLGTDGVWYDDSGAPAKDNDKLNGVESDLAKARNALRTQFGNLSNDALGEIVAQIGSGQRQFAKIPKTGEIVLLNKDGGIAGLSNGAGSRLNEIDVSEAVPITRNSDKELYAAIAHEFGLVRQ